MRLIRAHGLIIFSLTAVVFATFSRLMATPLFNPLDFAIIMDAHILSLNTMDMFRYLGTYFSQPILQLFFLLEYSLFCADHHGYIAVNLVLHIMNSFVLYMLVNMLFARKPMAVLAALLFAFTVGSYGKILMTASQQEALLLAHLHLLVLYFLIRNDFRHEGRLSSFYFLVGLGIFLLSGLTKASTFSLLGCLLAYKFFFYKERGGRGVFSLNLMILIGVGIVFYVAQSMWGYNHPTLFGEAGSPLQFTWISLKNLFRYLNLMIFPLQPSSLVERANPIVQLVFDIRTPIRIFLTLAIISYSFFGIVFGGRAIRFFIAWTYISVLPFTSHTPGGEWLNLQHLYLTSLGFCVILAAGTTGTSNLLEVRRWRRLLPYLIPLAYMVLALWITYELDEQNHLKGRLPRIMDMREQVEELCIDDASP